MGASEAPRAATTPPDPEAALVDASGRPMARDRRCPRCQAPPAKRVAACGFGARRPVVCLVCGYEFPGEVAD